MTLSTATVILGLLGIAIVWPVLLAAWALPEARVVSVATFVLAALAITLLAADTWAPGALGVLSYVQWLYLGSPASDVAIVLAVLVVVAPMVAGFMAAYRARSRGRDVPSWLIAGLLVPELMLVTGGIAIAIGEGRFLIGLAVGSYSPQAQAEGWPLLAQFIALPAAVAALLALGVTVWMLVAHDDGRKVRG